MIPVFALTVLALGTAPEDPGASSTSLPLLQDEATPAWTGSVSVGATKTSGNTDTQSASVGVDAVRRAEADRYTLRGWWNYGEQNDVVSERNIGGSLKYDWFANEKLYYLGIAGAEADSLANLDLRYYAGGGAGYQFREDDELAFGGEAALTYFGEQFEIGEDAEYLAARLAYNLRYKLSETTELHQTAEAFPSLEDTEDFYGKLDTRLRFDITEKWFAQLQWVFDYDNTPAAGAVRDDHRLVIGMGWSF